MDKEITSREYRSFQKAYGFFNKTLFAGALPEVLFTLQRKANSGGYFGPERFNARTEGRDLADEVALNPDGFTGRSDKEILSILVHEMAHVWQHHLGTQKTQNGYHNKEWAAKMKELGLYPSSTGMVGGKETGSHMAHYIIDGGPFEETYGKLAGSGFVLNWQSTPREVATRKRESKTKYTCPGCQVNAWGKPDLHLICGDCQQPLK